MLKTINYQENANKNHMSYQLTGVRVAVIQKMKHDKACGDLSKRNELCVSN
jgi:hypothetical protein